MKKGNTLFKNVLGLSMALAVTGCASTPSKVTTNNEIVAYSYISDDGRLWNRLSIPSCGVTKKLTPQDFKITLVNNPNVYLGETEQTKSELAVKSVKNANGSFDLVFDDVSYASLADVIVDCTEDALDCEKKDFALKTTIVDDFEKSTFTSSKGVKITYWLYTPKGQKNVPLMVWEHGGGEVLASSYEGANLTCNEGATVWVERYNSAVLSVQYPDNYDFGVTAVPEQDAQMNAFNDAKYELIQQLIKAGTVNAKRIYVSGVSSGGGGSLRFALQYPDLFAGALVICAKDTIVPLSMKYNFAYNLNGGDALKMSDESYATELANVKEYLKKYDLEAVKDVAIYFIHAQNDQVCTSYTTKLTYEALKDAGAVKNNLKIYTDEEMEASGQHWIYHSSWVPAFNDKTITDWVYSQSK